LAVLIPFTFTLFFALQSVTGPGNGSLAADGAPGRGSQPVAFGKDKTALPALGGDYDKVLVWSRGFGNMIKMGEYFFFGQG